MDIPIGRFVPLTVRPIITCPSTFKGPIHKARRLKATLNIDCLPIDAMVCRGSSSGIVFQDWVQWPKYQSWSGDWVMIYIPEVGRPLRKNDIPKRERLITVSTELVVYIPERNILEKYICLFNL